VGPQNGNSPFAVTAFETAVSTAMIFIKEHKDSDMVIQKPFELRTFIILLFCILLILIILWIIYKYV